MIQTFEPDRPVRPHPQIESVIALHGPWRVLRAALKALVFGRRRRRPPPEVGSLPDYLRRDLGLPPVERPRNYWEVHR